MHARKQSEQASRIGGNSRNVSPPPPAGYTQNETFANCCSILDTFSELFLSVIDTADSLKVTLPNSDCQVTNFFTAGHSKETLKDWIEKLLQLYANAYKQDSSKAKGINKSHTGSKANLVASYQSKGNVSGRKASIENIQHQLTDDQGPYMSSVIFKLLMYFEGKSKSDALLHNASETISNRIATIQSQNISPSKESQSPYNFNQSRNQKNFSHRNSVQVQNQQRDQITIDQLPVIKPTQKKIEHVKSPSIDAAQTPIISSKEQMPQDFQSRGRYSAQGRKKSVAGIAVQKYSTPSHQMDDTAALLQRRLQARNSGYSGQQFNNVLSSKKGRFALNPNASPMDASSSLYAPTSVLTQARAERELAKRQEQIEKNKRRSLSRERLLGNKTSSTGFEKPGSIVGGLSTTSMIQEAKRAKANASNQQKGILGNQYEYILDYTAIYQPDDIEGLMQQMNVVADKAFRDKHRKLKQKKKRNQISPDNMHFSEGEGDNKGQILVSDGEGANQLLRQTSPSVDEGNQQNSKESITTPADIRSQGSKGALTQVSPQKKLQTGGVSKKFLIQQYDVPTDQNLGVPKLNSPKTAVSSKALKAQKKNVSKNLNAINTTGSPMVSRRNNAAPESNMKQAQRRSFKIIPSEMMNKTTTGNMRAVSPLTANNTASEQTAPAAPNQTQELKQSAKHVVMFNEVSPSQSQNNKVGGTNASAAERMTIGGGIINNKLATKEVEKNRGSHMSISKTSSRQSQNRASSNYKTPQQQMGRKSDLRYNSQSHLDRNGSKLSDKRPGYVKDSLRIDEEGLNSALGSDKLSNGGRSSKQEISKVNSKELLTQANLERVNTANEKLQKEQGINVSIRKVSPKREGNEPTIPWFKRTQVSLQNIPNSSSIAANVPENLKQFDMGCDSFSFGMIGIYGTQADKSFYKVEAIIPGMQNSSPDQSKTPWIIRDIDFSNTTVKNYRFFLDSDFQVDTSHIKIPMPHSCVVYQIYKYNPFADNSKDPASKVEPFGFSIQPLVTQLGSQHYLVTGQNQLAVYKGQAPLQLLQNGKVPQVKLIKGMQQSINVFDPIDYVQIISRVNEVNKSDDKHQKKWFPEIETSMEYFIIKDQTKLMYYVLHAKHSRLAQQQKKLREQLAETKEEQDEVLDKVDLALGKSTVKKAPQKNDVAEVTSDQ